MTDDAPVVAADEPALPTADAPDPPTAEGAAAPEVPDAAKAPPRPGRAGDESPRTARDLRLARLGKRRASGKPLDNPLREGLRLERVPDPATFVLFGSTGDLAHRKVVPALFQLWRTNLLPHEFAIVAIGRRPYTDDAFRAELRASLDEFSRVLPIETAVWEEFAGRIRYQLGSFDDPALYDQLALHLDDLDRERGTSGNRLYYLATQPSAFAEIIAGLGRVGLDHEQHAGGWRRIVIEKPFGRDLTSAIRLNREVGKVFRESQVYRIDHYLGKETVRNILVFRFGNGIFEPIWHRRYVDHVQITVAESIGVEKRGSFYEEAGASRDFLQNHLMQLLSLVAMEPPATFDAEALPRREGQGAPRDRAHGPRHGGGQRRPRPVRARLGDRGPGAAGTAASRRSTRNPRPRPTWRHASSSTTGAGPGSRSTCAPGSGCRSAPPRSRSSSSRCRTPCSRNRASIPRRTCLPCGSSPTRGSCSGSPAKVPGLGVDVRAVNMDFTYGSAFSVDSPDAYETLILDALLGDASLFTRADEVEKAWAIVNPIIDAWADGPAPDFPNYEAGSWGPADSDALLARDGRRWRRI